MELNYEFVTGLLTLSALEIVLGIDNIIFIAALTQKLPLAQQKSARQLGLILACVTRLVLLGAITWITRLTATVATFMGYSFSWRDFILIGGGIFLIIKGCEEIIEMNKVKIRETKRANFFSILMQIMFLDIIFSLDSVITAVGMVANFYIAAFAIIIAVLMMLLASESLSLFLKRYPTLKMLALCFLVLVGVVLVADGFSWHIPRNYIYFSIGFATLVEILNIKFLRNQE